MSLLVTVQTNTSSENIASALSTWFSSVASSATVEPLEIVRYGASVLYYVNMIFQHTQFVFTAFLPPRSHRWLLRRNSTTTKLKLAFCWRYLGHILMARDWDRRTSSAPALPQPSRIKLQQHCVPLLWGVLLQWCPVEWRGLQPVQCTEHAWSVWGCNHVSLSNYFHVLPLQVAEVLSNSTSQPEVLQADAVSETAEVIETVLTDAAIADPMV